MKTQLQVLMLAFVLALGPMFVPTSVAAQELDATRDDLYRVAETDGGGSTSAYWACIDDCAEEFAGSGIYESAQRGWCYILRCTFK